MSVANIAYLSLVLGAYAIFMIILGVVWLRAAFGARPAPPRKMVVTPAHVPATEGQLRQRAS